MWIILGLLTAILGSVWSTYRVWGMGHYGLIKKIGILCGFVFIWFVPVLVRIGTTTDSWVYVFIYHFLYFLFVWNLLFFIMIAVRDFVWILGWLWCRYKYLPIGHYDWRDIYRVRRTNIICMIIALLLAVVSFYNGMKTPDIRETTLVSSKMDTDMTIVALNDLHLHRNIPLSKIKNIVERVNELQPDIIVFVGDTIDDRPSNIQPYMAELAQLKATYGKYAVAGNHEFYIGHDETKNAFLKYGITYLFNEGVLAVDPIYVVGIPDYKTVHHIDGRVDLGQAFHMAQKKDYKILLSHRPDFIDKLAPNMIDLQISGHTHGGQIFPLHILTKLANGYLSGLYETSRGLLYVSRGSGQWGPQFRLMAPSEISVIRLVSPSYQAVQKQNTVIEVPFVSAQKEKVSVDGNQDDVEKQQLPDTNSPLSVEETDITAEITPSDPFQMTGSSEHITENKTVQAKPAESILHPVEQTQTETKVMKKPVLLLLKPTFVKTDTDVQEQQAFENAKQSVEDDIVHILKTKQKTNKQPAVHSDTNKDVSQFKPSVVTPQPLPKSEKKQQRTKNNQQNQPQQPSKQTVVTERKVLTSTTVTRTVYPTQVAYDSYEIYPPEVLRPVFESHSIQDLPPELLEILSQPAFPSYLAK